MRPTWPSPGTFTPSYSRCATCMVFRAENPSLRAASCCSVDVVNGVARDLGERDAVGGLRVGADRLGDVPRDGLALTVEVGGQPQPAGALVRLLEVLDRAGLVVRDHVLGREFVA